MTTPRVCPQCGKLLPSDGPRGLCPGCLLKAAFTSQSLLESAATGLDGSSPATEPKAGTCVKYFGDYELLEEIARGGMGVVWKARQTSLKREVALKMIRAGALAGPDEVERFLREAEAAANLQHPNIVAIHEVGEHDGQHYFSMDYVAGRDLGALVKDGPLPPHVAARYVKIIAEAIHFAHQRGTLHRDLKPQNVLIDAADQPRITDFGLAKIMKDDSRLTQSGVVMGSPSYMPPEQAAGRHGDIGPASDVYSLGAMLYELLTSRPPFRGATALATLREVMEVEPTAPRRLLGTIPHDLETICLKCLEKSPSARYPTARALAEELHRYLKGEPILGRPASTVRKVVSWARRHPGVLLALATLVMVALAFGVVYLIEENAFLRAQQADPSLTRKPGPRHESLRLWTGINICAMLFGWGVLWYLCRRARGFSFSSKLKDILMVNAYPLQPLDERTRTFAICAGLIILGCGAMLLVTAMQAYVWEGESFPPAMMFFATIWLALQCLLVLIRDYRLVHCGLSEEGQPLLSGLVFMDIFTFKLTEEQKAEFLRDLDPPPWSLATPNWKAMGKFALWEAFLIGVWWYVNQPSDPVWAGSLFAFGFLVGMAIPACQLKGRLWALARLVIYLIPSIVSFLDVAPFEPKDALLWALGLIFGELLSDKSFRKKVRK